MRHAEVLVGIPEANTMRRDGKINNAALLYIHSHGSPVRGTPKRAVIEPAIEAQDNKARITKDLEAATSAYLGGRASAAAQHLEKAGIDGMNASKAWFTDARNHWKKDKAATIRRKGSDRTLIDTGQMRGAITYVVREG